MFQNIVCGISPTIKNVKAVVVFSDWELSKLLDDVVDASIVVLIIESSSFCFQIDWKFQIKK